MDSITPVSGGRTDTICAVSFGDSPEPAALRVVPVDRWGAVGRRHVRAEALGCELLAGSGLPTPRLIASDPEGTTGAYLSLTSWRPGRVRLHPLRPSAIDQLAAAAAVVHQTAVRTDRRPPAYASWGPAEPEVPRWTLRPALWARALEEIRGPAPELPDVLVHRDFHPGNVLWQGDTLTGLIDWTETSWGPAEIDVAHACTNFALLHDLDSAAAFRQAYGRHVRGPVAEPEAARYWGLRDLVDFLPDPVPELAALIAQRPDLTPELVRHRLDLMLAAVLS